MNTVDCLILLLLPLFSAAVALCFQKQLRNWIMYLSVSSAAVCFIRSCMMLGGPDDSGELLNFINVPGLNAGLGYILDGQSRGMMFIVTFIGLLVHIFSIAYMVDDESKPRYFGSLSMFMFSMTGIVLADNFAMMFIFWELVGLSSYLLIGHWFEKASASDASKKAFLTNRIGDFGFMIGILAIFAITGSLHFEELRESMGAAGTTASGPLATAPAWLLTLAALGVFMGAVGKSAQAPLHVWLPDAMEGPTPVSALIHAATMVAAGVYMLVRVGFIIQASETAMSIIAGVGAVTALMAALMAVQQDDIKRILAYSTLSQLGYMVMAVGLGAGNAGMFHLYTHAFFKALLFLGAGSVIYACHHEQDIWKMGGLNKKTQVTFVTFLIGTLALTGMPGLSGFWSKEEVLGAAHHSCAWCFWVAAFTALLTAFYMTRCVVVAFLGSHRSKEAEEAHEGGLLITAPLMLLTIFAVGSGYSLFAGPLRAMVPHHGGHDEGHNFVLGVSLAAFLIGTIAAYILYKGKTKDPLRIPLFANRFYIDQFYDKLVAWGQDGVAYIVAGLDFLFSDALVSRLPAALAQQVGGLGRKLQSGNLQGYTFGLGAGLLLVIYIAVFLSR
jgi:NADH-quinone oxidoreductase subunit L